MQLTDLEDRRIVKHTKQTCCLWPFRTMVDLSLFLLLPLLSAADEGTFLVSDPQTRARRDGYRREAPPPHPPYLHLPMSVDSRMPLVDKEYFSPAKGTGEEPLPERIREILLPARTSSSPPDASALSVKASCRQGKLLVQVHRSILDSDPRPPVKLGTCRPNKYTAHNLYFHYDNDMCGTRSSIINNQLVYTNTLHYDPPRPQGLIRRAAPFTLTVACYFNRYFYSYKLGYVPKMQFQNIFKPMKNRAKFILTPMNAQWERSPPSEQYILGRSMYFQAEVPSVAHDKRLYIHSCYATPEKSHTSTPQFMVVKNFGCMVESKDNRSRFVPSKNNIVRFTVDAFFFKGTSGQQLYMHCSMSVESSTPTPTAKSCNYDNRARRWVELYVPEPVCTCCDSICSSPAAMATEIISSKRWTVVSKTKPTTAPKVISTAATTTHPPTEGRTASQTAGTRGTAAGKTGGVTTALRRPLGGGGEAVVRGKGEGKHVKGSAVVELQEVTKPRRVFEEIFMFDK